MTAAVPPAPGARDRGVGAGLSRLVVDVPVGLAAAVLLPEWWGEAACLHEDPELFFPEGTAGPAGSQVARARQVCEPCPVRTQCLAFALEHSLGFGVWGGTSPEERRSIRYVLIRRQA